MDKTDIIIIIIIIIILNLSQGIFFGFRCSGREGRGGRDREKEREEERTDTGFFTFWMVKGRPTSGVDRGSVWTVTCAHDGQVLVKTSLQKGTFSSCLKDFSPEDPLVGSVLISEKSWFSSFVNHHFFLGKNARVLRRIGKPFRLIRTL